MAFRFFMLVSMLVLAGCQRVEYQFTLPPGDIASGRANYVLFQCSDCHQIADIPWQGGAVETKVSLGGKATRARGQGELVTSIINPNHQLSRAPMLTIVDSAGNSKMRHYNEVMSVQELIDLVAFLESEYELWVPSFDNAKGSAP